MAHQGYILSINPGSTSTKLGIFSYSRSPASVHLHTEVKFPAPEAPENNQILNELNPRLQTVQEFLTELALPLDLIMARGAPLRPLTGGTYAVDAAMLNDLRTARYAAHASNLAALMGAAIARDYHIPVYITDPVTTDEFQAVARISGVPGIERKSRSHALNIKASTRKLCDRLQLVIDNSRWVVAHLGGGISVAAVANNRIIDVNDALLGMGPFSSERAGALPIAGLLDLAYAHDFQRPALETLLSKHSGLKGYLGTADLQEVEQRIQAGDVQAQLIFEAMVYQISKEIAAMASVLEFRMNGILLTGGMAYSRRLCQAIKQRLQRLGPLYIEAGENELEALAIAGARVLTGEETVKTYGRLTEENDD